MSLDKKKSSELEQIISEMADSGGNPEGLRRVEELLLDDPALQDFYWEVMSVHTALPLAVEVTQNEFANSSSLAGSIQIEPPTNEHSFQQSSFLKSGWAQISGWPALSAVSAVIFCVMFFLSTDQSDQPLSVQVEPLESAEAVVHKLPAVTSVSWEGPLFENGATGWGESVPIEAGIIPLEQNVGRFDEGYLLCLPPGAGMTIVAIADATGENCLSITEIVSNGTSAIRRMSFTNTGVGPKPKHANPKAVNKRYGMLGRWSEFNASSLPKYFLLTGVYRPAGVELHDEWRISRMSLILEEPTVTYIGWDDSWKSQKKSGKKYRQDSDFDDLNAAIFFTPPDQQKDVENGALVVLEQTEQVQSQPNSAKPTEGFALSISPDETVILKTSTSSENVHRLLVTDTRTGRSIWDVKKQLPNTKSLGAIVIKNATTNTKELRLVVATQPKGSEQKEKTWELSDSDVLYQQPDFQIIGFDDGNSDKNFRELRVHDLRKVRVNILRYRGTLSAMGI